MGKEVLDVTCGSRMMWFDKQNPNTVYVDTRIEDHILCDGRKMSVRPDVVLDFRALAFADSSFRLVVFDPPHLVRAGKQSWLAKKYGVLGQTWQADLRAGFDECWRVLASGGTLIFKWNEDQVSVREVVGALGREPLFGHPTGRNGGTKWMCFLKTLTDRV